MAARMQTVSIPCRGGLNLSSNNHELLGKPGEAIKLVNFECSKEGGYRRISGYTELTSALPGTEHIKGVANYKGVLAARNDSVYHTLDNITWTLINKDSTNVDLATLQGLPEVPRTGAYRYMFVRHQVARNQYIFMVDGVNAPAVFSIKNEDTTPVYRYKELTDDVAESEALHGAQYCTIIKNQLVIAGMLDSPTSIFYSSLASSDLISPEDDDKEIPQENFNGSTSGLLDVGEVITGIKVHREALYVFCENSIFKVTGVGTAELTSTPVTRDIGCIDGFSIQEVGGNLLFLAPDGLRTIAKTERLDDIELGVISRKISPIMDPRVRQRDRYWFNSTILREKNQYRLWFSDLTNSVSATRGILASLTYIDEKEGFQWAFSETLGFGATCVDNSYFDGRERLIHGNQTDPYVFEQESGNTFNGTTIDYSLQTTFTDYGDISLRKCIHKVLINSKAEGNVDIGLSVRYDYNGSDVFQPAIYPLERITLPAIFGDPFSIFGDPSIFFGATTYGDTDVYTEGSGFTVSMRITSLKTIQDAPFDVQSFQVELTPGGKI